MKSSLSPFSTLSTVTRKKIYKLYAYWCLEVNSKLFYPLTLFLYLMFEESAHGGPIALDDISFTDGACS